MKWKLFFCIFLIALPGVYSMNYHALPLLLENHPLPLPIEYLQLLALLQGSIFVLIMAALGTALHHSVHLHAPLFEKWLYHNVYRSNIKIHHVLGLGLLGGILGAVILVVYQIYTQEWQINNASTPLPLVTRVLYGGITEEILLRWGIMTTVVWLLLKIVFKSQHQVTAKAYWLAIFLSALLFAVLHLPALFTMINQPPFSLIIAVIIGNSLFGIMVGWLYWKYGLESAIIAHITAHLLSYLAFG